MKNKLIILSLAAIIVLSAFLLHNTSKYQDAPGSVQSNEKSTDAGFPGLEAELSRVAETNMEISPERYNEIEKLLNDAEEQGYSEEKIQYLRNILSNLSVGSSWDFPVNDDEGNFQTAGNETVPEDDAGNDILIWHYNGTDWMPSREPPECPSPIVLQMPIDIELVTSVLYPGQFREGNYKSHGGFRLDNSGNDVKARAPMDGYLWRGNRFIQEGEVQYQMDIINPCGIMYMLDHLRSLPPKWMDVFSMLPEPSEDSLPVNIDPLLVAKGEVLATSVGMEGNVFMDMGVYDFRQKGNVTRDRYAICWFNLLQPQDMEKVYALPGSDYDSGKESDYC